MTDKAHKNSVTELDENTEPVGPGVPKTCPVCNRVFMAYGSQKHCSEECKRGLVYPTIRERYLRGKKTR